ncbi:cupin domain-containing protein [Martelella lutilitoris]|uniref:Cupin domain-containing protein n=1 Tax=Martelella lutilitoris TaxID=2583532 RepID=A0A7T7HGH0_9HYPH|nr:ChrR family anti-sigma-E factor [Martelella lutilitoris]QQM28770.1 cupin domain-containing protein [Martelella lutilitoris]
MTPITHHISDALLLEYAAGTLEEGWSLAVATHLALCPDCRKRLALMEAAGGALMESIAPETTPERERESWEAMLQRLKAEPAEAPESETKPAPRTIDDVDRAIPEPLRSYIGGSLEAVEWRRLGIGAAQYQVPVDGDLNVKLLRVGPGRPLPEHGHGGRELTLILKGCYRCDGEAFGPGDFDEEDEETVHEPVVTPDGECICLIVTDAPLRFKSRMMRAVQPFLGI